MAASTVGRREPPSTGASLHDDEALFTRVRREGREALAEPGRRAAHLWRLSIHAIGTFRVAEALHNLPQATSAGRTPVGYSKLRSRDALKAQPSLRSRPNPSTKASTRARSSSGFWFHEEGPSRVILPCVAEGCCSFRTRARKSSTPLRSSSFTSRRRSWPSR